MAIGILGGLAIAHAGSNLVGGFLSSRERRKAIDEQNRRVQQGLALYNQNRSLQKKQLEYDQKRLFAVNTSESYASGMVEDPRLIQFNTNQANLQTKLFDLETQQGILGFQNMQQNKPNQILETLQLISNSASQGLSAYNQLKV
jgi:hypothetical protein